MTGNYEFLLAFKPSIMTAKQKGNKPKSGAPALEGRNQTSPQLGDFVVLGEVHTVFRASILFNSYAFVARRMC